MQSTETRPRLSTTRRTGVALAIMTAVMDATTWVATDTPGKALWVVRDGVPFRVDVSETGLAPTGLAWDGASRTLHVGDLSGRVWSLELDDG